MGDMKHVFEVSSRPLDDDDNKVFVYTATGTEELGRPFEYEVTLLSREKVDLEKLLGEPLTVEVQDKDGRAYRYISGIVADVAALGRRSEFNAIKVTLRPWFWILSLASDNLVFQEKTSMEIIKQIFHDSGFPDYEDRTSKTYRKRDYCVQYGETTFDFVSRLMEEEGMYYFFDHRDGKHLMIICDGNAGHKSTTMEDGSSTLLYRPSGEGMHGVQHISEWRLKHTLQTEKIVLDSYDFEQSKAKLQQVSKENRKHAHAGLERYEYGQLWTKSADGKNLSEVRREEHMARYRVVDGAANAPGISTGFKMTMLEHPVKAENAEHLITATMISLRNSDIESQLETEESFYECQFSALKLPAEFRCARTTRKALVRGPQTAVVVGPKAEEIWTDKFGRVKVQFHWDRVGKQDEKSSCWIRVATTWAGNVWGSISIPRIGQEVIVDFLEGDPDQPIITGSVYNDKQMPPFKLPDNATQSGLRTRSSKGGDAKTFNELRFEDKKGSEEIYMHAEKDFKRVVENDDHLIVGEEKKDKGDQTIEIHNNRTATLAVGNDLLTVKEGNRTASISKGDDKLTVGEGNQTIDVKKKISIEAGDELHIKVGMSSLTMKKNGDITIKGKNIKTDGTGKISFKAIQDFTAQGMNAKIKGNIAAEMSGTTAKVEGKGILDLKSSGMAKLKGSINMIG